MLIRRPRLLRPAIIALTLGAVVAAARWWPPTSAPSADGLDAARQAADRLIEPTAEVIREDMAAYLAQERESGRDAQRPIGPADLVLTGDTGQAKWRLLAFRTRDTLCTLLVTGHRELQGSGCFAPGVIHPGMFVPQRAAGVYTGVVDESVMAVRAKLLAGGVAQEKTVTSPAVPGVRVFALELPPGTEAKTFELVDPAGRVINSHPNPYRP